MTDVKHSLPQILQCIEDKASHPKTKLECLNRLLEAAKVVGDFSKIVSVEQFLKCMRPLLVHNSKTMRSISLKIVRYYLPPFGASYIKQMLALKMDFFIARSLEKDKHSEQERIQSLKLVRKIIEIDCSQMSACIVQALVSCAENQEDAFCCVCLEALCDIAVRNPRVTSHCNGMRLLFDSVLDPFYSGMQETLIVAILYLLNDPSTRVYVRNKIDLQIILSPLTNSFSMGMGQTQKTSSKEKEKEKEKEDELNLKRWTASCKAVVSLLKSWTGIICLTSDRQGVRSLVDALKMPNLELHDKVLEFFFEIFRIIPSNSADPFRNPAQNVLSAQRSTPVLEKSIIDIPSRTRATRHNLLNNYISVLLLAFIDCGLIEGLVQLSSSLPRDVSEGEKERNRAISQKATVLLGELLHYSNTLLPPSECARLQTLPALVNRAVTFKLDPRIRSRATTMVTNLHAFSHIKATSTSSDFYLSLLLTGANKWKRQRGKDRRLDKMDEVRMRIEWAIDENQLKQRLLESNVLVTKDYTRWKWELISEVLCGALTNPVHLASALKTKFVKRILSFLMPYKKTFSVIERTDENMCYVRVACQLLEVLVSNEIGFEFLKDNKFLASIGEMLKAEIDASNPEEAAKKGKSTTRFLSQDQVLGAMAREYFTMLGALSSTDYGLNILTRNKIFDSLKQMYELPDRVDLCPLILMSLDYNVEGQSRLMLAKALTATSKVVRFLATRHMRVLLRAGVSDFHNWGIEYLVGQLNEREKDTNVIQMALSVLDEACDEVECLEAVIKHRPDLQKYGDEGKNLMLRFLSTPNGLRYLKEINYIEKEMQTWKDKGCVAYVMATEASLAEALSAAVWVARQGSTDQSKYGVFLPPHFYGELAKTQAGCDILKKSGHFQQFMRAIDFSTTHMAPNTLSPSGSQITFVSPNAPQIEITPLERRAALFSVAQIGSSLTGFSFIEQYDSIPAIIKLCETCPCLSLRGAGIYALGMLSRIEKAREIMERLGWESPLDPGSCIAVPRSISESKLLVVPEYAYQGASLPYAAPLDGLDEVQKEIIGFVGKLSNHITADPASRNLKRLRTKHPEYFTSAATIFHVLQMMSHHKFRLAVRRFIYECFDPSIMFNDESAVWDKFSVEANFVPPRMSKSSSRFINPNTIPPQPIKNYTNTNANANTNSNTNTSTQNNGNNNNTTNTSNNTPNNNSNNNTNNNPNNNTDNTNNNNTNNNSPSPAILVNGHVPDELKKNEGSVGGGGGLAPRRIGRRTASFEIGEKRAAIIKEMQREVENGNLSPELVGKVIAENITAAQQNRALAKGKDLGQLESDSPDLVDSQKLEKSESLGTETTTSGSATTETIGSVDSSVDNERRGSLLLLRKR